MLRPDTLVSLVYRFICFFVRLSFHAYLCYFSDFFVLLLSNRLYCCCVGELPIKSSILFVVSLNSSSKDFLSRAWPSKFQLDENDDISFLWAGLGNFEALRSLRDRLTLFNLFLVLIFLLFCHYWIEPEFLIVLLLLDWTHEGWIRSDLLNLVA